MSEKNGKPDWYENFPKFENNEKKPIKITKEMDLSGTYGVDGNDLFIKIFVSTENINASDFVCPVGGYLIPPGIHVNEEIYYVESGEAIVQNPDNGEAVRVKEGSAILIPRGTLHQVFNFGDKPLHVLSFIRKEWEDNEWKQLEKMVKENK